MTFPKFFKVHLVNFFNSHPHKEDDLLVWTYFEANILFSTHILTRRMTSASVYNVICEFFNSHPHKEDDLSYMFSYRSRKLFNSHPHKEDDNSSQEKTFVAIFSTHILTRRMTKRTGSIGYHSTFQLTSSQGGWPNWTPLRYRDIFFNSHPHKEDDDEMRKMADDLDFSTHILTRRMTISKRYWIPIARFSTHILTRRMTIVLFFRSTSLSFQLTSSQGGWPSLLAS